LEITGAGFYSPNIGGKSGLNSGERRGGSKLAWLGQGMESTGGGSGIGLGPYQKWILRLKWRVLVNSERYFFTN